MRRRSLFWLLHRLPLLVALAFILAAIPPAQAAPGRLGAIAYVFRGSEQAANSFSGLLTANGFSVDLVPLGAVLSTDFSLYDLIIIADDTGSLDSWGPPAPPATADLIAKITAPNKPILGLGEGGYAFFGKISLFAGWPNGWHGPLDRVTRALTGPPSYFSNPNAISPDPVNLYIQPVNEVGIYLGGSAPPADVLPFGIEANATANHAPLIMQGCRQLWGFSGDPTTMTSDGKGLFINAVTYARTFQCPKPTPPNTQCVSISKSADPADGTPVHPGQTISYTLSYTYSNSPNCNPTGGKLADATLVDTIPPDTIFVPGSASDGVVPGGDGALTWTIPPGATGTKTFKVLVADSQCHNQRTVLNQASLRGSDGSVLTSKPVTHAVDCPPVSLPNNDPPYAEREVSVQPYPLITGTPSAISVRLTNSGASPQAVKVSFQTSPQRFGIGISFSTFDSKLVTIPAGGSAIVDSSFTPVSSGHYCIQIKIEDASPTPQYAPIYTQRNLDVAEDLTPGKPDDLVFKVANPTSSTSDINLVVDNTCPGWTAQVIPATLSGVGPNGSDVRDATLRVTPPNPATLGSGCHIDVQGWAGGQMIGGIRKLDVPPVQLPPNVDPPWLEPEISVAPTPLAPGQPAQICVELQNPLAVAKTVTLHYAVADFGAGLGFTSVATQTVTLPPNSLAKYCASWTPAAGGTLHRCILITLEQPGYRDMQSQHNIDLERVRPDALATLQIPVSLHNPDVVTHTLEIVPTFYGIDPLWQLRFIGDPPPTTLGPGQTAGILIGLNQPALLLHHAGLAATAGPTLFGDESRIDVAVKLDGQVVSGFTIQIQDSRVFLPLIRR